MAKEYIIIAALLIVALVAGFVAAEDVVQLNNDTTTVSDTNASSDTNATGEASDVLNGTASAWKIGWQRAKIALTFNQEKKAMEELKLADLRLIQARIAAKNGNEKAMANALEAHDRIIEKVQARVAKMDGAKDEAGIKASAEKLTGLARAIEVHQQRIEILKQKLASANLTEDQKARLENKIAKVENNTQKLVQLQESKKENLKNRLTAMTNKTDEEINKIIGIEKIKEQKGKK